MKMKSFRNGVALFGLVIVILWVLELVDVFVLNQELNQWGIYPRDTDRIYGIICAPFLHGGLGHLASNTLPFVILGGLIAVQKFEDWVWVTLLTALSSGVGIWLLGNSNSIHIGASGIVFGYFGFLLGRAYFQRSFISITIAFLVFFFYGGMIWGLNPLQVNISWLGHLFGLLGGIGVAAMWIKRGKIPRDISKKEGTTSY